MSASHDTDQPETRADLVASARIDFLVFAILLFPVLHGGDEMKVAEYVDLMTGVLAAVTKGGPRRLIFNLPPGYMKSMLVSILYTAWRLGVNPSEKFICISYGDDLTHDLSRKARLVMQSAIYKAIFPLTVLDKKAEDLITTTRGGQRYATSVGSDISGFRADQIILDDPIQPDEASNESAKQKLRDWYYANVPQRLLNHATGVITLVMHRQTPDDLTGTFLAEGGWSHFAFPLIAIEKQRYFNRNRRHIVLCREPGDLLNPNRDDPATIQALKDKLPSQIFEPHYQQRPQYGGSGMCSIDQLARYKDAPPFELFIQVWDLAATKNAGDWTVGANFGLAKDDRNRDVLYLVPPLVRVRIELPDVRALIIEQDKVHKPALILVDADGIGRGVHQDLTDRRRPGGPMRNIIPSGNLDKLKTSQQKLSRFLRAVQHLYDGLVVIPESMPGLEALLSEIAAFPNGSHDDQVDVLSAIGAFREHLIHKARFLANRYGLWAPAARARLAADAQRNQRPPEHRRPHYFERNS